MLRNNLLNIKLRFLVIDMVAASISVFIQIGTKR